MHFFFFYQSYVRNLLCAPYVRGGGFISGSPVVCMDEEPSRYSVERGLGLEVGWFLCLVKQREREKAMTEPDQIRHSLVTQRGYQVISLSWLGNNYRAVRSCRFFMKFRGENIFSHSFTRNLTKGTSARCFRIVKQTGGFFYSSLFFLFLSCFVYSCIVFVRSVGHIWSFVE